MSPRLRIALPLIGLTALAASSCSTTQEKGDSSKGGGSFSAFQRSASATNGCPTTPLGEGGPRTLALLVGVGAHSDSGVQELPGATADVDAVFTLLASDAGYGIPGEQICVLLDKDATVAGVEAGLGDALLARARPGDNVLIYFAGHGTGLVDDNMDEPDPQDEAWQLYDGPWRDDALAAKVAALHEVTPAITLIIDAAAAQPDSPVSADLVARWTPGSGGGSSGADEGVGDGARTWHPSGLSGVVTLSASRLGTAVERDGQGVFTGALLAGLATRGTTYDALARTISPVVTSSSGQVPGFDGATDRVVLDGTARDKPLGWIVSSWQKGGTATLEGIQMPGWSDGALVRVFDGAATSADAKDPAKAKGVLLLSSVNGFQATATAVVDDGQKAPKLLPGDIAVLLQPGTDASRIQVSIRTGKRPGELSAERSAAVEQAISEASDLAAVVELVDSGGFVVASDESDAERLRVWGPEGSVRNSMSGETQEQVLAKLVENLRLHARQKALRNIQGDPGTLYENNQTVQAQLVPGPTQDECAQGVWIQADPNAEQIVPMCHRWQVEATVSASSPTPLEVGGVVLFNDGNIVGFPTDGQVVTLEPGESYRFPLRLRRGDGSLSKKQGLKSAPPLGITEHVVLYGTQVGNTVRYVEMSASAVRGEAGAVQGLVNETASGTRDSATAASVDVGAWTSTQVAFRVEANTKLRPDGLLTTAESATRELTLPDFDITPYLPANENSYLYKVLMNAEMLARWHGGDGINYAQCVDNGNNRSTFSRTKWPGGDCWTQPYNLERDALELTESPGIDCSTTTWFIYTRACKGDRSMPLPKQNRGEKWSAYMDRLAKWHREERLCLGYSSERYRAGYLATSTMQHGTDPKSPLHSEFDSCMGEPVRTGDILVTRNSKNSSGHTYIVIDPDEFIVFGSHYGDTSYDQLTEEEQAQWAEYEEGIRAGSDIGIEYQFLAWRKKTELEGTELGKWGGFSTQRTKGCWRHRKIIEEWEADPSSRPGSADLASACDTDVCLDGPS